MAISSYGVTLKWGENAEAVTKVVDVKDYGDLIGDPNLLDTTTLSDPQKMGIPGIKSGNDTIPFTCNFTKADFTAVQGDEGKNLFYELAFSDGSKFTWQGQHSCSLPGKGVDEVVEFVVNVIPSTPVVFSATA